MRRKTKRVMSTAEKLKRDLALEKKKFLRKCERLNIQTYSYDEADRFMICGYSVNEYQLGCTTKNSDPNIGNLYVTEEDYDRIYLES